MCKNTATFTKDGYRYEEIHTAEDAKRYIQDGSVEFQYTAFGKRTDGPIGEFGPNILTELTKPDNYNDPYLDVNSKNGEGWTDLSKYGKTSVIRMVLHHEESQKGMIRAVWKDYTPVEV